MKNSGEELELFPDLKNRCSFSGIDENGYGPVLGPLVVTSVKGNLPGDPLIEGALDRYLFPLKIEDSKRIFLRSKSSYSGGEIIAHALLECAGIKARTLRELTEKLTGSDWKCLFGSCEELEYLHRDYPLPIWAKYIEENNLRDFLSRVDIKIEGISSKVLFAPEFNKRVDKFNNKALLDLSLFVELLKNSESHTVALVGKIGGMRRYQPYFEMLGIPVLETIYEEPERSSYRISVDDKDQTIHFIRNGDEIFFPIAFASIIGKYLRELFMFSFNQSLGFKEKIPYGSGYRHDSKTYELIQALKKRFGEKKTKECFLRSR